MQPKNIIFMGAEDLSGQRCDFNCEKKTPLISLTNTTTGHQWYCHRSCLRDWFEILEVSYAVPQLDR
jgi:hypothetical protein